MRLLHGHISSTNMWSKKLRENGKSNPFLKIIKIFLFYDLNFFERSSLVIFHDREETVMTFIMCLKHR